MTISFLRLATPVGRKETNSVFDGTNLEMYRLRLCLDFRMVGKLSFVPGKSRGW